MEVSSLLVTITDSAKLSLLLDVADSSMDCSLLNVVMTDATDSVETCSLPDSALVKKYAVEIILLVIEVAFGCTGLTVLLDNVVANINDGAEICLLVEMVVIEVTNDVVLCLMFDKTLIADNEDTSIALDTVLVGVTDIGVIEVSSLLCIILVNSTDASPVFEAALVDVTNCAEISLLLENRLVEEVNIVEVDSLLDTPMEVIEPENVLVDIIDGDTFSSLFNVPLVTDAVDNIVVLLDIIALVLDTTLIVVMLDTALVDVTDGVGIEVLVNKLVCSLVNIIPDVNSLGVDSKLVKLTDGMEVTSLLEMILTVVDGVLLDTDIDNAEVCSLAVLGMIESSLLFIIVLVEVTVCTDVSLLFDAAVVKVTDAVDVILLIDTVLVAVMNCSVEDCSLLDMIFTLVTDDAYVDIEFSDTEMSTVTLVGTTDLELSSLLATATAEVTVCAEFSSLLDIASVGMLGVFDSLLITDGTDSCSVLTEAMDDVVADLLVDAEVVEITNVAVVGLVDSEEA